MYAFAGAYVWKNLYIYVYIYIFTYIYIYIVMLESIEKPKGCTQVTRVFFRTKYVYIYYVYIYICIQILVESILLCIKRSIWGECSHVQGWGLLQKYRAPKSNHHIFLWHITRWWLFGGIIPLQVLDTSIQLRNHHRHTNHIQSWVLKFWSHVLFVGSFKNVW